MKVAIYARSTCGHGDVQLEHLRALAAERGWQVVAEYVDEAIGSHTLDRSGLQELLDDAEQGDFERVLVADCARLSRNPKQLLRLVHLLAQCEVKIICQENLEGGMKCTG